MNMSSNACLKQCAVLVKHANIGVMAASGRKFLSSDDIIRAYDEPIIGDELCYSHANDCMMILEYIGTRVIKEFTPGAVCLVICEAGLGYAMIYNHEVGCD
jgi:hypothetical protein